MDKQSGKNRPGSTLVEIAKTKNQISLGERRLLLPRPQACPDTSDYQKKINLQRIFGTNWIGSCRRPLAGRFTVSQKPCRAQSFLTEPCSPAETSEE
jgi:hypothetical protein